MDPALVNLASLFLNLVLSGGLIAVWLNYRVRIRGENRIDFDAIIKEVTRQRDDERDTVKEYGSRIENLEAEIQGLRIARDLDPFPNWIVDLQGCYRFVNREFETYFLEPDRKTYRDAIGKSREDIWPEEFCKTLRALDAAARSRPDGTARATTALSIPNLGNCEVTVHKFPVKFKGAIIAFAGYMTVMDPYDRKIGQSSNNLNS